MKNFKNIPHHHREINHHLPERRPQNAPERHQRALQDAIADAASESDEIAHRAAGKERTRLAGRGGDVPRGDFGNFGREVLTLERRDGGDRARRRRRDGEEEGD